MKKEEANKERLDERARKKALYNEYKLLPKGVMKTDFNILHGRYGAGKRKKQPRYMMNNVLAWENPVKETNIYKDENREVN